VVSYDTRSSEAQLDLHAGSKLLRQVGNSIRSAGSSRRIVYIQYTNPAYYPPLEHSSYILAQNGWQILFLGVGSHGQEAVGFSTVAGIDVKLLPIASPGWRQKFHYVYFAMWSAIWILRWRPNWLYASDLLVCPMGLLLSLLPKMRVAYHEHDSPSRGTHSAYQRLCLWARRRLVQRTKICILPNHARLEEFVSSIGTTTRIIPVWNCPANREVAKSRSTHSDEELSLYYHGSIVPERVPVTLLDALSLVSRHVRLAVAGYETDGSKGHLTTLRDRANQLGINDQIRFIPTVPTRRELLTICTAHDVGVALMPMRTSDLNERTMAGASNKGFDYLACGLALLVSNVPDYQQMYVTPEYGLACDPDSPASIAKALQWFLDHPRERKVMGERGRERIQTEWNYEKQFSPVLEILSS
jgi:glycosyltransferase involved in cell wall biosynthesis